MDAMIFDLEHTSMVDGPGLRTTVFFKGCNLRCLWCHNPESQLMRPEMMLRKDKCTRCGMCQSVCPQGMKDCTLCGRCALYCPHDARKISGAWKSTEDILTEILQDKPFYDQSGGGVTFSGGECLLQIDALHELLRLCREAGVHTAVDTAGHADENAFLRILPHTSLFLYDVKCLDSDKHRRFTGQGNEKILKNLSFLLKSPVPVWVRIPVIPSFNDTVEDMTAIRDWLHAHGTPERIELLPYHTLGEGKYQALKRACTPFSVPNKTKMDALKRIFAE